MGRLCTQAELEWKLIYAMIVAGKSAVFANHVVKRLKNHQRAETPMGMVRRLIREGCLRQVLEQSRSGNYAKLERALSTLAKRPMNLAACTPCDLERIAGIGPKTSRFFIMWTRPEARYAALDVHILRWLKLRGYEVPRHTPQSSTQYARIERWFLEEADRMGKSPRVLDLEIWAAAATDRNEIPADVEPLVA